MQIRKSLDKVIALAGGCLVFATGGGTIAAGAALLGSGASLFNAWREGKEKHGPESERILAQMLETVRGEFDAGETLSEEEEQLLESADHALDAVLLESIPPPAQLVEAFGRRPGFAKAVAALVLAEVAARDDLFAETGARAQPLARRFALAAIEAAMETALTNQAYFSRLLPFVLEGIKQDTRETQESVRRLDAKLDEVQATSHETAAEMKEVRRLLEAYDATPGGKRARQEIGDSRPFVVLARKVNQEVDDRDQALAELSAMVELMLQQQAEAARGTNLGDPVDAALQRIAEKARRGEFDSAAREAAGAFAGWEEREAERREAQLQVGMKLVRANVEQNMLRRDAEAVAEWIERGASLEVGGVNVPETLMDVAGSWYERGDRRGIKFELEVACAVARRAVPLCVDSDHRGAALNWLGATLNALSSWEEGTVQLEATVTAFRAALKEYSRERAPNGWAMTQNNLGAALRTLGEREDGVERLEEAASAFREALKEYTREKDPYHWAGAHLNLGTVLTSLGERENDIGRLEQAVEAYQAALEEWTLDKTPMEWAMTQRNLGNALVKLGERESGSAHLQQAAEAYRAALGKQTRDQVPLLWAATILELALVTGYIAQRTGLESGLDEAMASAADAHSLALNAGHRPYVDRAEYVLAQLETIWLELAGLSDRWVTSPRD